MFFFDLAISFPYKGGGGAPSFHNPILPSLENHSYIPFAYGEFSPPITQDGDKGD
jgi:hypothetical protein